MAVDSVVRWQLIRDVIVHKKSGAIVIQTGTNYLYWILEKGNLVCISATFAEASLTHFVQEKKLTESTKFLKAQNQIDQDTALGLLLIRNHLMDDADVSKMLFEHWISCTEYLFDPSAHLFWSSNQIELKPDFVRSDRPLRDVLLQAKRESITIPSAVRSVQELKPPFRVDPVVPSLVHFTEEEKRIWMYLQSGSTLKQIMQDRDIARIPCYKTLFLLWLCGYISDSRRMTPEHSLKATTNFLEKIPPEWVIPLCAGALIGVLLAPASAPNPVPQPPARLEPLNESLQKPAWSHEKREEEINAKAQRREDDQ